MTRHFAVGALTVLLLGVSPSQSDAQYYQEYMHYCTAGSLRACQSMQLWANPIANGGTELLVRWRNEQGSNWGHDNTGGSSFGAMTFYADGGGVFGSYLEWIIPTPIGNVGEFGANPYFADAHFEARNDGVVSDYWWYDPGNTYTYWVGCDNTYADFQGLRTCGRDGVNGWVEFGLRTTGSYDLSDLRYRLSMATAQLNDRGYPTGVGCTFDPAEGTSTCVQVTPEPSTLILLSTALLGLWLAARRWPRGDLA